MDAAPSPRVLVSGLDWLEVFTQAQVDVRWTERLQEAKKWAQDGGRATDLDVAGHRFKVQPIGARNGVPYLLKSEAIVMQVNPFAAGSFPTISAELHSPFLWQHGARGALERGRALMACLSGFGQVEPKVTRTDLAVDFQGWGRPVLDAATGEELWAPGFELSDLARFQCRARRRDTHHDGTRFTGFSFGAGGDVLARLYNKSEEIRSKSPDKMWFHEIWGRSPGYRAGEDVWRLEFQLRRKGWRSFKRDGEGGGHVEPSELLREAGIGCLDTYTDLERAAPRLWAYLAGDWLAIRSGKRTRKSSKRPLDPAWAVVAREGFAAGGAIAPDAPGVVWGGYDGDLTRVGRSAVLTRRSRAFAGVLAAEMAAAKLDDPSACGDELIWGAVRRAELQLEAKGTDLDTRAEERLREHLLAVASIRDAKRLPPLPPPALAVRVPCPRCNGRQSCLVEAEVPVGTTTTAEGKVVPVLEKRTITASCWRCDGHGDVDAATIAAEERPPALEPVEATPAQGVLALPWEERGTGA